MAGVEQKTQTTFKVPQSVKALFRPMGMPKEQFKPENILMLSGHGFEKLDKSKGRPILQKNQYALIPGGCGLQIQTPSQTVYKQFFDSPTLNVFNASSKNKNVSDQLGITYSAIEEQVEGGFSPKKESQLFKLYYPDPSQNTSGHLMVPMRSTIPYMEIVPLMTNKESVYGKQYLTIELSGILRKTDPVLFPVPSPYMFDTEYVRHIEYEDGDLEKKLSESHITEHLKLALAGSLLTYDDLIKWINKGEDTTVNDLIEFLIPLPYIFDYISSKIQDPYLLIVLTCRHVEKPPLTPGRSTLNNRKKIIKETVTARRSSLRQPLLFNYVPEAGGGGGGAGGGGWETPTVGLDALGFGGGSYRRRTLRARPRRVRRRTRRVRLRR